MTASIHFNQARFLMSAPSLAQCPFDAGAEVAFAGRSNAGKSSAINALTRNGQLARTSKTPGQTRLINFFQLTPEQRLVDLPGYGYAKVPREVKAQWDLRLAEYLRGRQSLRGLILLMDIRHPLRDYDWQMLHWAAASAMPVHILLTKADKLGRNAAHNVVVKVRRELADAGFGPPTEAAAEEGFHTEVQTFSTPGRIGLEQLESRLRHWLATSALTEA